MSKEIELSRRENGLTIRFLAQPIINDAVFPDQRGIKTLLSKAKVICADGTKRCLLFDDASHFEYYFLFHNDDFGSGDKSEIDLLLRQGDSLFAIEVKAFTNPNDTEVKREIVRNHLTLQGISGKGHFDCVRHVFSILLFSEKHHILTNPSAPHYNYFNESFLQKMGKRQSHKMKVWESRQLKMNHLREGLTEVEWDHKIEEVSSNLFFLNWKDVADTLVEMNEGNRFDALLSELRCKRDTFFKHEKGYRPCIELV